MSSQSLIRMSIANVYKSKNICDAVEPRRLKSD